MAQFVTPKSPSLGKIHGGKFYLARPHVQLLPKQISTFIEPYVGMGSVFCNLHPDAYERAVIGETNPRTWLIWHHLLGEWPAFDRFFQEALAFTYDETTFREAVEATEWLNQPMTPEQVQQTCPRDLWPRLAAQCLLRSRGSRGGMGKAFAWSERKRGGKPGDLNAWENGVAALPSLRERLLIKPVQLMAGQCALQTIEPYLAAERPCIYLDPPYRQRDRSAKDAYGKAFEADEPHHVALLKKIRSATCRVAIAGYGSSLYDSFLSSWDRHQWKMANHAGQNTKKQPRIETLWRNYV